MAKRPRKTDRRFHESTSRAICRLAFVLLGAVPLLWCTAFSVLQLTPVYKGWLTARWEQTLEQALDLPVEIESVEPVSPNVTVLRGLVFSHRETGALLCRASSLRLENYSGQCLVRVESSEIDGARMREAWEHLHDFVLCRPYRFLVQTSLQIDSLHVHGADDSHDLSNIRARVFPEDKSTWLDMSFLIEPSDESDAAGMAPTKIVLRRYHEESMLTTESRINAGDRPLPCSLVQRLVPELKNLGPQAELLGTIFVDVSRDGWVAQIKGADHENSDARATIRNVDFARLSWSLPDLIEGVGSIDVHQARFGNKGIESLQAALILQDGGWISSLALEKMQRFLGVAVEPGLIERSPQGVHFQLGYFKFELSAAGLRLTGYEPSLGTMLGGRNRQALAWRPNEGWRETIPMANLVAVLQQSAVPPASVTSASVSPGSGAPGSGAPGSGAAGFWGGELWNDCQGDQPIDAVVAPAASCRRGQNRSSGVGTKQHAVRPEVERALLKPSTSFSTPSRAEFSMPKLAGLVSGLR